MSDPDHTKLIERHISECIDATNGTVSEVVGLSLAVVMAVLIGSRNGDADHAKRDIVKIVTAAFGAPEPDPAAPRQLH